MHQNAWVSFCISTFQRPEMLEKQIRLLLTQSNPDFEVIVSDNDPSGSGVNAVNKIKDPRVKYWRNDDNLGMIRSFNKSIERATTEYIVMVTDDDPIDPSFLAFSQNLITKYPGLSVYGGFSRAYKEPAQQEEIQAADFCDQCLDPRLTTNLLWSSVVLRREDVLQIGSIPDYGSPHLADHALLALTGSVRGAAVENKMYSTLSSHDTNFSKSNLDYYYLGCKGFYETMMRVLGKDAQRSKPVIIRHLNNWFLANFFMLRKYYVLNKINRVSELDEVAARILELPYMKSIYSRYFAKRTIFAIKRASGLLKQ